MKGTIFEKSTTSLHLWFYAMYLMASTRCGISAKQMERELGVTYKTAHRMMKKIRTELMTTTTTSRCRATLRLMRLRGAASRAASSTLALSCRVPRGEADRARDGRARRAVRARVIPSRRGPALSREVRANVNPTSIIFTDDWPAYKPLKREYLDHRIINHSAGLYVDGSTHTNTIEGFFGNLKTGMRGAYKKVSPRYLQSYLERVRVALQPQTDDTYRAIGRYVVEFSRLIFHMRAAVVARMSPDDQRLGMLALGEVTAWPIAGSFFAMCRAVTDLDEAEEKVALELGKRVGKAIEQRNDIVHGDWFVGYLSGFGGTPRDPALWRIKPSRHKGPFKWTDYPVTDLEVLADGLHELRQLVAEFGAVCLGTHPLGLGPELRSPRVRDLFIFRDGAVRREGPIGKRIPPINYR
jgi:transposase